MYKILRMVLDERRKGSRCLTGIQISGNVEGDAAKKAVTEKVTAGLEDLTGLEFFDAQTGKIKIKSKNPKPPKIQTVDEKMCTDFQKLQSKPGS